MGSTLIHPKFMPRRAVTSERERQSLLFRGVSPRSQRWMSFFFIPPSFFYIPALINYLVTEYSSFNRACCILPTAASIAPLPTALPTRSPSPLVLPRHALLPFQWLRKPSNPRHIRTCRVHRSLRGSPSRDRMMPTRGKSRR